MTLPEPYYRDEQATIYNCDCRSILQGLSKVDLCMADPPYGIGACKGVGQYGHVKFKNTEGGWDDAPPDEHTMGLVQDSAHNVCIWGGNYFNLSPSRCYLVWDKGAGFKDRDFAECEMAWCSWDANAKIKKYDPLAKGDYRGSRKRHPTQKPVEVINWAIQTAPAFDTILDPFMGSGTTLVAAKQLGRKAIGVEISQTYCDIAIDRLRQGVLAL